MEKASENARKSCLELWMRARTWTCVKRPFSFTVTREHAGMWCDLNTDKDESSMISARFPLFFVSNSKCLWNLPSWKFHCRSFISCRTLKFLSNTLHPLIDYRFFSVNYLRNWFLNFSTAAALGRTKINVLPSKSLIQLWKTLPNWKTAAISKR